MTMPTNFLPTHIESHRQVANLTTNQDVRINIEVSFQAPDTDECLTLWRSHLEIINPCKGLYRSCQVYSI